MKLGEKLPKSWDDINFRVYQELIEIRNTEWESDIQSKLEELALLLDISPADPELESLYTKELYELIKQISWIYKLPPTRLKQEIEISGTKFQLIDISSIKMGEFIDIEHFLKEGEKNFHLIAAILYRQTKTNEWGNVQFEPYEYDLFKRAENFKSIPCTQILGAFEYFSNWKKEILKTYTNIFEDPDWDKIEGEEELPVEEVEQIKREIETEKRKAPHSWIGILLALSNGNAATFPQLFELQAILVFNILNAKKTLKI
jgi:hypothetical protein